MTTYVKFCFFEFLSRRHASRKIYQSSTYKEIKLSYHYNYKLISVDVLHNNL